MRIGQVAKNAGITVEAIRFWEKEGLIQSPPRSMSGYRDYPKDVVQHVSFVKQAKELGFSLKEVKELMSLRNIPDATCKAVKEQAEAKILAIDRKMEGLQRIRKTLAERLSACPGQGPLNKCPIIGSIEFR